MVTKKIIIQFNSQPVTNDRIRYQVYINGVVVTYSSSPPTPANSVNLLFKASPSVPNDIQIGATLSDTINNTLAFLSTYYAGTASFGGFSTTLSYARVNDTIEVSITSAASLDLITFWNMGSGPNSILLRPETPCDTYLISTSTIGSIATAIDANGAGSYKVKDNDLNIITNVTIPGRFSEELTRGVSYSLLSSGDTILSTWITPASVTPETITIYFSGNTLYIVVSVSGTFQYSIDGTTWQSENSFADLAEGSYTVYIRDGFGCQKTFNAENTGTVNHTNDVSPLTYISESNSIRFAKRVSRGNCSGYRTVFDTLSCEENTRPANKFVQLFQTCDIIKTQVKTSYENVYVAAGSTEITAEKIVSNIGLSDKRDCLYYDYNGALAVVFISGNIYNYGTTDIIGTYELNGDLPEFGTLGTWLETPAGTFQVIDIRIDDSGQRSLILNSNNTTIAGNDTIQTIYNREAYDIWEFSIDMSAFTNTQFSVGVMFSQTAPDEAWPDVYWISEKVSVKDRWANTFEIIWSNSKNTDIYFFSGIVMKNRLALCRIWSLSDGDVEIQKTDTEVLSIDAEDYAVWSFEALGLTTGMKRKITRALKHDGLFIEGQPYTLGESVNSDNAGTSNMYKVTAKLYEKSDVWTQGNLNQQDLFGNQELIGLLGTGNSDEFIKIL